VLVAGYVTEARPAGARHALSGGKDCGRGVLLPSARSRRFRRAARRSAGRTLVLHGPYATALIARGPSLTTDGGTATGSVHILELPDPAAARTFAFEELNYQAAVYRDVLLRRWRNMLGRAMWETLGSRSEANQHLLVGLGPEPAAELAAPSDQDELIAYGPLLSDDGTSWLGTAALLRATDPVTARAFMTDHKYAHLEVHIWQPGGRPS
jgi:uncharacterized protein YciI